MIRDLLTECKCEWPALEWRHAIVQPPGRVRVEHDGPKAEVIVDMWLDARHGCTVTMTTAAGSVTGRGDDLESARRDAHHAIACIRAAADAVGLLP